ncbi:MAG: hypothetical protein F6K35_50390, partial [Okeania sp. SIO2H7]|nr:hypothetical protein [Okeania sp. SIO2H7]
MAIEPQGADPTNPEFQAFLTQVRGYYTNDTQGFATYFNAAVENLKPIPEGTDPDVIFDWTGATIDTLINFLTDWYA